MTTTSQLKRTLLFIEKKGPDEYIINFPRGISVGHQSFYGIFLSEKQLLPIINLILKTLEYEEKDNIEDAIKQIK